jgi:GWxTD domain-containing protein
MLSASVQLLLVLPFLGLGGGGPDSLPPFPVEARGDIHFRLDAARFLEDSTLVREIYVGIPQDELAPVVGEEGDTTAQARIQLDFLDPAGKTILSRTGLLDFSWLPSPSGPGLPPEHLVTLRPEWPPGTAALRVQVTDPNATKRGLLYAIRGTRKHGEATGRFPSREAPAPGGMSDILFVWSVSAPETTGAVVELGESGRALRQRIQPNPAHFCGLYHRDLAFYVELYPARAGSTTLVYEVERQADSTLVRSHRERIALASSFQALYRRFDISDLAGGTYRLRVRWERDSEPVEREAVFQVLWESQSWYLSEKELVEDASVLLSDEEYRAFLLLDRGNKERYMEEFWRAHDPSPGTPRNEIREEFEKRKAFAQANFGGFRKGKLSDRGRIYIRFGEPDEIVRELNPQDEELLGRVIPREFTREEREYGAPRDFSLRDNRAYEIWYYHLRGDPLLPEYLGPQLPQQLKFIFVDQMGYGEYTLIYTNVFGGYR